VMAAVCHHAHRRLVYTRCIFCHARLGVNAVVESLPVGRRLAYDAQRSRLWVICCTCARWNLTALEERAAAIDECERIFRAAQIRFSTENIGMARLDDGTTLVRIGRALPGEVAAWRYGAALRQARVPRLVRRFEKPLAAGLQRVGEAINTLACSVPSLRLRYDALTWLRIHSQEQRVLTLVEDDHGRPSTVRFIHLEQAELLRPERGEPWRLHIGHERGSALLTGERALRVAARLLAALNGRRATAPQVREAVARLDDANRTDGYFAWVAALALRTSWGRFPNAPHDLPLEAGNLSPSERRALRLTNRSFWGRGGTGSEPLTPLPHLPLVDRLALEMAAHEETERRALEGELRLLEDAWREAEEIAEIADSLLDGPPAAPPGPAPSEMLAAGRLSR
jgi:hypothetical protein